MSKKTWGGRFTGDTDRRVEAFTESISYDRRLYRHDIRASQAHARMLAEVGLLTAGEAQQIVDALDDIAGHIERGDFAFPTRWKTSTPTSKAPSSSASATSAASSTPAAAATIRSSPTSNSGCATPSTPSHAPRRPSRPASSMPPSAIPASILPGYTHFQRAQPVLAAHYFLAYVEKYQRDRERLADCRKRVNVLPLGAAALAGTSLPIDRESVRGQARLRLDRRQQPRCRPATAISCWSSSSTCPSSRCT